MHDVPELDIELVAMNIINESYKPRKKADLRNSTWPKQY